MHWLRGIIIIAALIGAGASVPALGATHEVRLPLHDGRLQTPALCAAICREMHLPAVHGGIGEINLSGLRGSLFVSAFNAAMDGGCRLSIEPAAVVLRIDPQKLPASCDRAERAIRVFTATLSPRATERQSRRWGLFIPPQIDQSRPLIVLIHGLDSEKECMTPLGNLLIGAGYQVGYFAYPDDQPIEESVRFLGKRMATLRAQFPSLKTDIIAHSMGGLVARGYVEGENYNGGVDRLILIGTPNAGSRWASLSLVLKAQEQFHEWKNDPRWSWTWPITTGLDEAGRDLQPHSLFLDRLNKLPRRAGVRYTIIAGSQNPADRMAADAVQEVSHWMPRRVENLWGFRNCRRALENSADHLRHQTGGSDGAVKLSSAMLAGVADVVVLPADHGRLICACDGHAPAAWPVIRDRLNQ